MNKKRRELHNSAFRGIAKHLVQLKERTRPYGRNSNYFFVLKFGDFTEEEILESLIHLYVIVTFLYTDFHYLNLICYCLNEISYLLKITISNFQKVILWQ